MQDATIDCAIFSNPFYDEIVEAYWNGSFWTPGVEAITTEVLNFAAKQFSNILYTAIKEVNITLPDFTPSSKTYPNWTIKNYPLQCFVPASLSHANPR